MDDALGGLKWDAAGLITVVVQDHLTGELRMLAHANREALELTLASGEAHFFSRSRAALWLKGETSGTTLRVHAVWIDCDGDAAVYLAEPAGPSCHTGRATCFFRRLPMHGEGAEQGPAHDHARAALPRLWAELESRRDASGEASYTRKLLDAGSGKIGDKLREEADELARAVAGESDERVAAEAADVVYHLLVGLLSRGVSLRDVEAELARRFGVSGLAEKASRG